MNLGYTEFKSDLNSRVEQLRTKEPNRSYNFRHVRNLRILIILLLVLKFCVAASSVLTYYLTVHSKDMTSLCTNSSVDTNLTEKTFCSKDSGSYNIHIMALCPKDWEP